MSEWKEYALKKVIEKFIDYRGKTPKKSSSGIPLITAKIVKSGKIIEPTEFILEEDYDLWMTRGFPRVNDVVLTTEAPLGEIALIKDAHVALGQRLITLRGIPSIVHNPFLKYYFQSSVGQHELQSRASGTTVFGIKASVLREVPILLPPLPEQEAIATVLSSLDDKIDLLHRQNETLEAMAETLFRLWFIEEAQADWEERKITDLFEIRDGTHDSPKQSHIGKPLITSKHIGTNRLDFKNAYLISDEDFRSVNKRSKVDTNDILFSMIGTIGLSHLVLSNTVDYAIKNIGLFKTSQNSAWRYYIFLWINSLFGRDFIHEHRSGSTQEYISLGSLRSIILHSPPQKLLAEFNLIVDPVFRSIEHNMSQVITLEKLRNTLLPKLMSGRLRIEG